MRIYKLNESIKYVPKFIDGMSIEDCEKEILQWQEDEYSWGRLIDKTRMWDLRHTIQELQKQQSITEASNLDKLEIINQLKKYKLNYSPNCQHTPEQLYAILKYYQGKEKEEEDKKLLNRLNKSLENEIADREKRLQASFDLNFPLDKFRIVYYNTYHNRWAKSEPYESVDRAEQVIPTIKMFYHLTDGQVFIVGPGQDNSKLDSIRESLTEDVYVGDSDLWDLTAVKEQLKELLSDDSRLDFYIDTYLGGYTIELIGKDKRGKEFCFHHSNYFKDNLLSEESLKHLKEIVTEATKRLDLYDSRR